MILTVKLRNARRTTLLLRLALMHYYVNDFISVGILSLPLASIQLNRLQNIVHINCLLIFGLWLGPFLQIILLDSSFNKTIIKLVNYMTRFELIFGFSFTFLVFLRLIHQLDLLLVVLSDSNIIARNVLSWCISLKFGDSGWSFKNDFILCLIQMVEVH